MALSWNKLPSGERRAERRRDAERRQVMHDELTAIEKLEKATRRGGSQRERVRLIEAEYA